jgi:hypothetical protein
MRELPCEVDRSAGQPAVAAMTPPGASLASPRPRLFTGARPELIVYEKGAPDLRQ